MMKLATIFKISLGVLLAQGALVQAAEVAGRVLVAVGDTSATRNGQEVKLVVGSAVESGDTLKVGEASNMQVRFTDAAVMALRPNTIFRLDEYAFKNQAESDKSVFALLKGGLRTVTGLIGRNSRSNYAVKTDTSTIGIRGTHYTLVSCSDNCRGADGGLAPNGTYGGVTDGRIVNANQAGEREFGKDEYFYVANATSLPQPLLSPPSFLRDRLEGQAKAPGKGSTASAAGKETSGSGDSGNTKVSNTPVPVAETPTQITTQQVSTAAAEQTAVKETVVASPTVVPPNPFAGYSDFATAGVNTGAAFSQNTLGLSGTARTNEVARLQNIYPQALNLSTDVGYSATAGQVHWGHWFGPTNTIAGMGEHWAVGIPTLRSAEPTSGTFTYDYIGGTRPTDSRGNIGSITSGGALSLDFTARFVKSVKPITWTVGGNAYSLLVNGSIDSGTSGTPDKNVLTCGSCTSPTVDLNGQLTGNNYEGAIVGIHTSAGFGGTTQETGSAQVYGRNTSVTPTPTPTPATTYNLAGATAWSTTSTTNTSSDDKIISPMTAAQFASAVVANPSLIKTNFGSGDVSASSLTDTGTNTSAGNVFWGVSSGSGYPVTGVHGAIGDAVTNIPTSGVATYSWVGGTHPRDSLGGTGTWTSGSVLSIDFTSKLASTVGSWNWSVSGRNYSLSFAKLPYDTGSGTTSNLALAGSGSNGYPTNPAGSIFSVTGTSGSVAGYGVWLNGSFVGNGAAGALVAIASQQTESGLGNVTTASTQVFGKSSSSSSSSSGPCTTYPCSTSYTQVHGYVFTSTTNTAPTTSAPVSVSFPTSSSYAWAQQYDYTYKFAPTSSTSGTSTGPTVVSSSYTPGATLDQGLDAAAGNLEWKRFSYQSTTTYSDGSSYSGTWWDHYMSGDRPTAMPSSGSYTFSHIGGTQPTDQNGNVGTLTSGGSWNVDFATKTVSTVTPVTWNVNNVSYNLSVPAQVLTTNTSAYSAPDGSYTSTYTSVMPITNINLTCSPNCSPNAGGSNVAPGFFGTNALGLGVGYATSASVGGTNQYTSHVQAYRR